MRGGRKTPCSNRRNNSPESDTIMATKIVTEADRKRTPRPKTAMGNTLRREGTGQKSSLERGKATPNKKNPGKRAHKGG
jgi:hypothetical protein